MSERAPVWHGEIARYLTAHPKVLLAFMFGSEARGKPRPDSDVDVAVYLDQPFSRQDIRTLWSALEDITHKDVDLVVLNDAPPGIAWAAFKGEVLVKRNLKFYLEKLLEVSREAEDFREFAMDIWRARCRRGREGQ